MSLDKTNITVIDAENHIMGRLASIIAKRLLNGENIVVVNAEKIVITGSKKWIQDHYTQKIHRRTLTAPWKGPFQPRRPDRFFKRVVRGMLPWKTPRGRTAYKRLRVYIGIPDELKNSEFEKIKDIINKKPLARVFTLGELCRRIGWTTQGEV